MHDVSDQEPPSERTTQSTTDPWDHLQWWAAVIASVVWLSFFVYFASLRGDDLLGFGFMLLLGWLLASLGLAAFWFVIAVVAARAFIARNTARAWRLTAFLVPFVVVVVAGVVLWSRNAPLLARFEISEGSLNEVVDDYERTGNRNISGWAGLYRVEWVRRWENCTVIVTGTFFLDEYGFARCTGPPPSEPPRNIKLGHIKGDWWTYDAYD